MRCVGEFHAAVARSGGERSWSCAAVNRSTTAIGPPHLGQRQQQFGLWSCKSREAAIQADQYPREYQHAWVVEILQAGKMEVYLSRKFGKITRATQRNRT
jgi:hypothetical protein